MENKIFYNDESTDRLDLRDTTHTSKLSAFAFAHFLHNANNVGTVVTIVQCPHLHENLHFEIKCAVNLQLKYNTTARVRKTFVYWKLTT